MRSYWFLCSHNLPGNELFCRMFQVLVMVHTKLLQIISYFLLFLLFQNPAPLPKMSEATTAAQPVFWLSGMKYQRMTRMELLRATTSHTKIGELE